MSNFSKPIYRRIIVKLTGESFSGDGESIHLDSINFIAGEIKAAYDLGVDVGVVVGGGNIVRGAKLAESGQVERVVADHMGMISTTINALALSSFLRNMDLETRVQSAIEMRAIAEPAIRERSLRHFEKKRVVIFSAGTGNPNFSTDTAAVLRASEVHADAIIKATKVDGIYSSDPKVDDTAVLIPRISYEEAFQKRLKFMDAAAIGFAMENYPKPIHVVNVFTKGNLTKILLGEQIGSCITPE